MTVGYNEPPNAYNQTYGANVANLLNASVSPSTNDRFALFSGQEPSVWIANGKFNMLYTGGGTGASLAYRSCLLTADPTVAANWTAAVACLGNGSGGQTGTANHSYVILYQGTLYCAYNLQSSSDIYLATADVNAPTVWTVQGVILAHASIGAGASGNTCLVPPGPGTDGNWLLFLEYSASNSFPTEGTTNSWQIGLWSCATVGGTYTAVNAQLTTVRPSPNGSASGPDVKLVVDDNGLNPQYVMYYHGATWGRMGPTDIYRATIPAGQVMADAWTLTDGTIANSQDSAIMHRAHFWEFDQLGDPFVFTNPNNGASYLIYEGTNNRTGGSWFELMITPLLPAAFLAANGKKIFGRMGPQGLPWYDGNAGPNKIMNMPWADPTGNAVGSVGTWAVDYTVTGGPTNCRRFNSTAAQNDKIQFGVQLAPGVYRLTVVWQTGPANGIVQVGLGNDINAVGQNLSPTFDTYSAAPGVATQILPITILGYAPHQWALSFTAGSKNASSTGFTIADFGWSIQRTTPPS